MEFIRRIRSRLQTLPWNSFVSKDPDETVPSPRHELEQEQQQQQQPLNKINKGEGGKIYLK